MKEAGAGSGHLSPSLLIPSIQWPSSLLGLTTSPAGLCFGLQVQKPAVYNFNPPQRKGVG